MERVKEGEILDSLVEITKHKDVELLEISLAKTIFELFEAREVSFFRELKDENQVYSVISVSGSGIALVHESREINRITSPYRSLFEEVRRTGKAQVTVRDGGDIDIHPLFLRDSVLGFLVITLNPGTRPDEKVIGAFLSVYANYHSLLVDYQHDTLTGLLNRKTFEERLYNFLEVQSNGPEPREPAGSKRKRPQPSWVYWLGMLDIDNFKRINDTFGHVYGDEVLISLASIIKQSFRPQDIKLRFGGEEFVVVIRARDKQDAINVFERFRKSVEKHSFGLAGTVTVSVGILGIDANQPVTSIVGRADQALYHAKKSGKNRVSVYEDLVAQGAIDTSISYGDVVLF